MSTLVQCPSCGARLRVAEAVGDRVVRCPKCTTKFQPEEEDKSSEAISVEAPASLKKGEEDGIRVESPSRGRMDDKDTEKRLPPRRRQEEDDEDDEEPPAHKTWSRARADSDDEPLPPGGILPGAKRAIAAIILLLIQAGVDLVYWVFEFFVLIQILAGTIDLPRLVDYSRVEGLLQGIHLLVLLASFVLFCMWFYRVYANLVLMGVEGLEHTPGWAVGWLFVPLVNLFRPCLVAQEIWKASKASASLSNWKDGDGSNLIGVWWGSWVAGVLISELARRLVYSPFGRQEVSSGALKLAIISHLVGYLLFLAADILLILVIRAVMRRQQRKFSRVFY